MALTFHRVPKYGYFDIQAEYLHKPEGYGWNNLGQRKPKGVALHRMVGTLAGTRIHFRTAPSLTDFGMGIEAVDGKANAGVIHQYNNPLGYRSGWASGPVSAPYGDGKLFVAKFGINAVNRDLISIETSGTDQPLDAFSWGELVHLCAWWIDYMEIPYSSLPLNPHTGINALIWHQEFTIGTGKKCPFSWLMANTDRLYKDIAAFLKPYQEGAMTGPVTTPPKPIPAPAPTWMPPAPVKELALIDPTNEDNVSALRVVNGTSFIFVNDEVMATQQTKRLRFAYEGSKVIGPDIKAGERFSVLWLFKGDDGHYYYYTPYHSRVRADHTKRISD